MNACVVDEEGGEIGGIVCADAARPSQIDIDSSSLFAMGAIDRDAPTHARTRSVARREHRCSRLLSCRIRCFKRYGVGIELFSFFFHPSVRPRYNSGGAHHHTHHVAPLSDGMGRVQSQRVGGRVSMRGRVRIQMAHDEA